MTAQTVQEKDQLREALIHDVELEVDRKVNLSTGLLQHHRIILQNLPFDGAPELITDAHRAAIERLVDKNRRYDIKIKRIIGYASEIGDAGYNLNLSRDRAVAVFDHLRQTVDASDDFDDNTFYTSIQVLGLGESHLPHPTNQEQDNPLNRRVEIVYILKYQFPTPAGVHTQTSTMWKIDFGPAGAIGTGTGNDSIFGIQAQAGPGQLTMLPDGETGPATPITKPLTFEQVGASIGLFEKLKDLNFIQRFPLIKRLLKDLHPGKSGPYPRTQALLSNLGFSVDFFNAGGEFETGMPLNFAEMRSFHFATISGGISILGKAEGALLMIYNQYFFTYTVIFGVGQDIALPDASLSFIPAGFVQVNID